jgi:hypothetical protein
MSNTSPTIRKGLLLAAAALVVVQIASYGSASKASAATKPASISVDGILQTGWTTATVGGATLLPVKPFAAAIGASIKWDQSTKSITITQGSRAVTLTVNSKSATINGKNVKLTDVAQYKDGI